MNYRVVEASSEISTKAWEDRQCVAASKSLKASSETAMCGGMRVKTKLH
jgi:hypothetical protein